MTFVRASVVPMPEATLEQPEVVQQRLMQVMALDIPALLIRGVHTNPEDAHALVRDIVHPAISFGMLMGGGWRYTFEVKDSRGSDFKTHMDAHQAGDNVQLNEYSVQKGRIAMRSLRMLPHVAQAIADGANPYDFEFGRRTTKAGNLHVDDELVVPTAFHADLEPGDVLYHTESRHPHQFRSVTRPRHGTVGIYHPQLTDIGRAILESQRQQVPSAPVNPYSVIFPEAA